MTSSMDRRNFIKTMALLAAGAAALPKQIEAFERYYMANAPDVGPLIAVDEIVVNGMATSSLPMDFWFYKNDKRCLPLGINAFGGIFRWVAAPDHKIITTRVDFYWKATPRLPMIGKFEDNVTGTISYIDEYFVRQYHEIKTAEGSLDG